MSARNIIRLATSCNGISLNTLGRTNMSKLSDIENGTIRQINAYYRANDCSHQWPICNKFDVTERAIRRLRKEGLYNGGLEYFLALDAEISSIVNNENNW